MESVTEMSDEYKRELRHIVTVSGDTELLSAPAYYYAARKAPSVNAMISAMAIIQDELSHAHIAYCILEDLGVSREWLMYEREPHEFRYPYAFDVPLDSWVELCVANAFYDQAGFCLLSDVHDNTSYGPWKRGLVKVGKEENFHLLHGRRWMKRTMKTSTRILPKTAPVTGSSSLFTTPMLRAALTVPASFPTPPSTTTRKESTI